MEEGSQQEQRAEDVVRNMFSHRYPDVSARIDRELRILCGRYLKITYLAETDASIAAAILRARGFTNVQAKYDPNLGGPSNYRVDAEIPISVWSETLNICATQRINRGDQDFSEKQDNLEEGSTC